MLVEPRSVLADRYELGAVLGRGGMAEVRAGHDRRLGRKVAVKCFDPAAFGTAHGRARFEAEARAGAALSHPNVVTVYDVGVDQGMPFLVMERLPGRTFADEITQGVVPVERVIDVMGRLLDALAAAHDRGVLHRDLKPANVLLTDNDEPKLADFGIAVSGDATLGLTATGLVLGTPVYLAPERVDGEPATVRSDLYAVGVICYEALTGVRPFDGDNAVAVAYAARHATLRPIRALRPEVPAELAAVVGRAMARLPDDRFASASELALALEEAPLTEGPIDALDDNGPVDETVPVDVSAPTAPTRVMGVRRRAAAGSRRAHAPVFGGIAGVALLAGAIAFSHQSSGPGLMRPAVSSATTASLPSELQAPFDKLQGAVDK